MKKLVTDDPQDNMEVMMNLAFVKDKEVWIRGGGPDGEDCTLIDFSRQMCMKNHECQFDDGFPPDIAKDDFDQLGDLFMECSMCGCPIGTMYFIAIQAAELRERLRMHEKKDEPFPPKTRTNSKGFRYDYCGKCGHQLMAGVPKRCDNCGQAVSWSAHN